MTEQSSFEDNFGNTATASERQVAVRAGCNSDAKAPHFHTEQ